MEDALEKDEFGELDDIWEDVDITVQNNHNDDDFIVQNNNNDDGDPTSVTQYRL